jgi:dTDP-3-amino-3,4,6-trideoxy-alpha-D-glucose transaminase
MSTHPDVPFLDLHAAVAELRPALDEAYRRVMDGGRFILGDELARFEEAFAKSVDSRYAVGVGNGLDALAAALHALGVGPGDEVVVPAHTFVATWTAVAILGATPVAAQPAPGRFNVSVDEVRAALTPRTRAVVVVHLYGEPVDIEPIEALCAEHRLPLVEDAAQAHGARRRGRPVGSMGQASAFSFYPGKNLGAFGDAGAVTTSDPIVAERVRRWRNYGALQKYDHDEPGRNSRLDPLQAAFLTAKLDVLPAWNARRRRIAERYRVGLSDLEGLALPEALADNESVWHLYVVRLAARDELAAHLRRAGIETQIHYPRAACRCAPFAARAPAELTESDVLAREVLSLPMGPHLRPEQVDQVIASIREFAGARQGGPEAPACASRTGKARVGDAGSSGDMIHSLGD